MEIHHERAGAGAPLVLVHGLGSTWRSWDPVLPGLAAHRDVVAVDLPGFGGTPPLEGEVSIASLADALVSFLEEQGLRDADLVGSSVGARLVLELARRGVGGDVVALDPGGFWDRRQLAVFGATIGASIRLVRGLRPVLPVLTGNPVTRSALLAQLSPRPWALPPALVLRELRGWAAAPSYDALLAALVHGPPQEGAPAGGTRGRVVLGWGRQDRVVTPSQAAVATDRFPDAQLHWFESCGHFPMWDQPEETVRLVLESTGRGVRTPGHGS
ncbi:alpha/beta fold hydrolase [uncultured Pseudokineococcus sp.]|uniref:alpha/beta fold hydrolase n=1 Tax=uncultured Pseudokineococcus sp. TaxID=1642928 RepID=UPI002639B66D|nr:alpha/beta fold hydrolase [uncultured Pseudokineococcus sp.]